MKPFFSTGLTRLHISSFVFEFSVRARTCYPGTATVFSIQIFDGKPTCMSSWDFPSVLFLTFKNVIKLQASWRRCCLRHHEGKIWEQLVSADVLEGGETERREGMDFSGT